MYQNIYELLRRYEFNRTEPETLVGLVEEAVDKGESAREEQQRLRKSSADLLRLVQEAGLILDADLNGGEDILRKCAAGVDGSHQPVGGIGGKWYVPMSCALVIFNKGIQGEPVVEVASHIEAVQEEEFRSIRALSSEMMLRVETKAILRWAMRDQASTLFIDGPIVDPPLCERGDYVQDRCAAIRECLRRNIKVIGCAKRVQDAHFKNYLSSKAIHTQGDKGKLKDFPTDLQLIAFMFAHNWREVGEQGKGVYTHPFDVSDATKVYKLYRDNGVCVFSTFIQKSVGQHILRLDLPFLESEPPDENELLSQCAQAVCTAFAWSYPDQNIPLPIFIAHTKCEIRRGCAEVLYEEIITRMRTTEPIDQIVALQLEARL